MIDHSCVVCGQHFESKVSKAMYCSRKCASRAQRQRSKIPKPDVITCPQCGKDFKPQKKNQKYCCRECQVKYSEAREKEIRKAIIPKTATCLICASKFKPHRAGAKYCSEECRKEAHNRRNAGYKRKYKGAHRILPEEAVCPVCGITFKPHHHRQKNCSRKCTLRQQKINENMRVRKKYELKYKKPGLKPFSIFCKHCGRLFVASSNSAKYCSEECKKAGKKTTLLHNLATQPPKIREARIADFGKEELKIQECKYCGKAFSQPIWSTNPFCSGKCEIAHYKKGGEELTKKSREARELGLSYGEYMGYIQMGKNPADFAKTY